MVESKFLFHTGPHPTHSYLGVKVALGKAKMWPTHSGRPPVKRILRTICDIGHPSLFQVL